jgi:hypothetical protein
VIIVFTACVALTELLARTALAKPLTGRSRVARRARDSRPPSRSDAGAADLGEARSAVSSSAPVTAG